MTHCVVKPRSFYGLEPAKKQKHNSNIPKDCDLVQFVLTLRYIKTFIRHQASLLVKELCLDPAEAGWIAHCGGSVMDCVYTVFHKYETMLHGSGQPQWHTAMRN